MRTFILSFVAASLPFASYVLATFAHKDFLYMMPFSLFFLGLAIVIEDDVE